MLNNITDVLLQEWISHLLIHKDSYAIKQKRKKINNIKLN